MTRDRAITTTTWDIYSQLLAVAENISVDLAGAIARNGPIKLTPTPDGVTQRLKAMNVWD
ncbi:MAG: hypothetical protein AAFP03_06090 [Cyanobacteria bacterium J06598_3]